jgi:hypothetical protein
MDDISDFLGFHPPFDRMETGDTAGPKERRQAVG